MANEHMRRERTLLVAREAKGNWIWRMPLTLGLYYLWWKAHHIEVTTRRLILRQGVFSRQERSVALDQILDVVVTKGFLGRLFNFGDISIQTAGSTGTEFHFEHVANPLDLRDTIYQAQEALRQGRQQRIA
jgi:uncharacterized membrane protein YdbT with pleckstrin-like domain